MNQSYSNVSLLFATVLGGVLAGCATQKMEPPHGGAPLITLAAHGVQVYECRAAAGAAPAWAFVGPEAYLFDPGGLRIGRHGAGPSWQHEDGSGFSGTVRSRIHRGRAQLRDALAHRDPAVRAAARVETPTAPLSPVVAGT